MNRKRLCLFISILATAFLWARVTEASQAIPVNMNGLMAAELIFTGKCVEAKPDVIKDDRFPGGLIVTRYTFEVFPDGVIKGEVPEKMSFVQWGATRGQSIKQGVPFAVGMPRYEVGGTYTVFLTSESRIGLRSTVGLGQGKFSVITAADGKKQVINDRGNRFLFTGLPQTSKMSKALSVGNFKAEELPARGAIDFDSFVSTVRELNKKDNAK